MEPRDISAIEAEFLVNGVVQVLSIERVYKHHIDAIRQFMLKYGIYFLPTLEAVAFIKVQITGFAIEVGCGHGTLGRALGIPTTDSKRQEDPLVMQAYSALKQPPIPYPDWVEKLTAEEALIKYNPDTAVGGFITHRWNGHSGLFGGIDEYDLLKHVERYVNIGNLETHSEKPLLRMPHFAVGIPELITRSADQSLNRVFVWTNKVKSR